MTKVSVIGAGAWGTALAMSAGRAGCDVMLWARESEVVECINKNHENSVFFPGVTLEDSITATSDINDTIDSDIVLLVSPAQFLRSTCEELKNTTINKNSPLLICSKGIEQGSLKLMSEVVSEILPNPVCILSGPTFSTEVANNLPTFVNIACDSQKMGNMLAEKLSSPKFKLRYCDDVIGAQIGGAVKNVIAIACGIADGKGMGENARSALIIGGLREMEQLCLAKGGKIETIMRLCGIGDLILTCSSKQSRNNSLGFELGQGKSLQQIIEERKTVAEGVASSESVSQLARNLGLRMPICEAVHHILHEGGAIEEAIAEVIKAY